MGSNKSKTKKSKRNKSEIYKPNETQYINPTTTINVKLQILYILNHWNRQVQVQTLPNDILQLIIDKFCYHPLFDKELKQKLIDPQSYVKQTKLLYSNVDPTSIILKILLVGDSGVGKSNISTRYCNDEWYPQETHTIGIDFNIKSLKIEQRLIRLQIWDISGRDCYNWIIAPYCRVGHGIIMTYDITNRRSFERIDNHWNGLINQYGKENMMHKLLMGNKLDLIYDGSDGQQIVSTEDAKKLASKLNVVDFVQVSAKLGTNIDAAFNDFVKHILRDKISVDKRLRYPFAD